ncbi:hypothetical protein L249_8418 [Ophiocordyceps polyrhachis-furcata BCC 54312]|uniref:Uncharacterized protein n=1 Tax=Ophiocordyceps polyrhachis-furcata BCC 54312 TaxID=1330021 RepID=A0A367L6S2_9HYPO|nr:hypothetical protein L249_8418 [Ophiocordyceps polyrhachis-furcata BCC 54312]
MICFVLVDALALVGYLWFMRRSTMSAPLRGEWRSERKKDIMHVFPLRRRRNPSQDFSKQSLENRLRNIHG